MAAPWTETSAPIPRGLERTEIVNQSLPIATREAAAARLIADLRWPSESYTCPYCQFRRVIALKRFPYFRCYGCDRSFSVKVGTIFQGSPLPLFAWATTIDAVTASPTSSAGLARDLAMKQGAAWQLLRTLRIAASLSSFDEAPGRGSVHTNRSRPVPTPKPTRDIYRVGYQPKFYLPLTFEQALSRYLAIRLSDFRMARDQFNRAVRRPGPTLGRLPLLSGDDDLVDDLDLEGIAGPVHRNSVE